MDAHIRKVYVPMTETGFYILLCLREQQHGYGIVQKVKCLTHGEICLSPGTMYGSLSKMEKDGLIRFVREEEKRRIYEITPLGTEVLELEMKRIERLYQTMKEARWACGSERRNFGFLPWLNGKRKRRISARGTGRGGGSQG